MKSKVSAATLAEQPTERPLAVTQDRVAALYAVCGATVRQWEIDGILPSVPLGPRGKRYLMTDVLAVAEKLRARAAK